MDYDEKDTILSKFTIKVQQYNLRDKIRDTQMAEVNRITSYYKTQLDNNCNQYEFYEDLNSELALILTVNRHYDDAIDILENILTKYEDSTLNDEDNNTSERINSRISMIKDLQNLRKDSIEYQCSLIRLHMEFYEIQKAGDLIKKSLFVFGENLQLLKLLLEYDEEWEDGKNKAEIYKRILKFQPDNKEYLIEFAYEQRFNHNEKQAIENIFFALKLDSTLFEIWESLDHIFTFSGDVKITGSVKKKLISIIEKIDFFALEPETILIICTILLELKKPEICVEILTELIKKSPDNFKVHRLLAETYFYFLHDYDIAIEHMKTAISLNGSDSFGYLKLSNMFMYINKFKEAARTLEKIKNLPETINYEYDMFMAYSKAGEKENLINGLHDYANDKDTSLRVLLVLMLRIELTEKEWIEIFEDLNPHDYYDKYFRGEEEVIINHIINITSTLKGKGRIRYHLFKLYRCILALKYNLHLTELHKEKFEICHYSNLKSLNYLIKINDEDDNHYFRLNSVAYVNDPSEGLVLIDLIKKIYPEADSVLSALFDYDIGNKEIEIPSRGTYIASFSLAKNKLPLWIQYAQNGEGCCYVIDSDNFDTSQNDFNVKRYQDIYGSSYNYDSSGYCLYKVHYLNSDGILGKNQFDLNLKNIAKEIGNNLVSLQSYFSNGNIKQIIVDCLDQIRFLFKEDDYEHEKEVRVIKFADKEDVRIAPITEGYRVPHIYIDLEKSMYYKEIILGPRTEKATEIAQFINMGKNVGKVSISTIKYR